MIYNRFLQSRSVLSQRVLFFATSSRKQPKKPMSLSSLRFLSFYDRQQKRLKIGVVVVACVTFLTCLFTIVDRLITDVSAYNPFTTANRVRRRLRQNEELIAFYGAPVKIFDLPPSSGVSQEFVIGESSSRRSQHRSMTTFYVDADGRRHIKITFGVHGSKVSSGHVFVDALFVSTLDDDTDTPSLIPQKIVFKSMIADAGSDSSRTFLYENGVAISKLAPKPQRSLFSRFLK